MCPGLVRFLSGQKPGKLAERGQHCGLEQEQEEPQVARDVAGVAPMLGLIKSLLWLAPVANLSIAKLVNMI